MPPALLEALSSFLQAVEDMGPAGAGVFAATVALAELVPLLPTTPLALASGLLFGAAKGALLVIAGNLTAATLAFYISRGIGARFARKMVAAEGGAGEGAGGEEGAEGPRAPAPAAAGGGLAARFASVTAAIEAGTPAQKFAAVFALRLTPVVPFSASNYALGLSPIGFPVYFAATALGGSVWASVYASLGAASRALLGRGASLDVLVADLIEQATGIADDAATGLVLLSVGAAAGWGVALAAKAARGAGGGEGEEGGGGRRGRGAREGEDERAAPEGTGRQRRAARRQQGQQRGRARTAAAAAAARGLSRRFGSERERKRGKLDLFHSESFFFLIQIFIAIFSSFPVPRLKASPSSSRPSSASRPSPSRTRPARPSPGRPFSRRARPRPSCTSRARRQLRRRRP